MVDYKDLVKVGVHFGHQTARWNPKMAPYIWGFRRGIHLIDVSKTAHYLEQAAKFLENIAAEGKTILLVGTKKAAQGAISKWGTELKMPYVTHRWVGGTLTNFPQVKKSVTKLLHFEDILARSENFPYTKKEFLTFQKMVDRLNKSVGGIRNLAWPIGAIALVDVRKEKTVLSEAQAAGIPVVALVDTNCDPSGVDYVIPGNDDAPKAVNFIIDYLGEAVKRGQAEAAKKAAAEKEEKKSAAKGVAKKIVEKVTSEVTKKDASENVEASAEKVVEPEISSEAPQVFKESYAEIAINLEEEEEDE
ncbi:TPA: 30S ribosomal protein S2 [Candidatus Dependentiae bacterium]|nr:MAG: 30S ribosomal protein S2 [candidate division TM6 bacterium GW2011_GWF2_36_131]KKQ03015.1 MAG: 30S ribosomal protein S2 [candidate division TM6 bacterium GW2011_GWE2_36_25]KKQ19571.1 MAG: 30S ribosomal protein S2 [candidate division TM6 bacterium GW2011_GWA2_36_9]HBR71087.1 30S ribosomal protein S2 [Candidatus Dependentiae bacterium]HCU01017.1 30S ribosomal protein S2 [Candidatus Dependentiae bacterium]